MDVRRLLFDQIERLWGAGELDLVRRNYAPDIVDHMPVPGQLGGLDGMEQVVREFRAGLPDLRMELHGTIVAGDLGCDWWTLMGTNTGPLFGRPPTGRRVVISGVDILRVVEDRIAEIWHVEDMAGFEAQLAGEPVTAIDLAAAAPDLRIIGEAHLIEGDLSVDRHRLEGAHTGVPLFGLAPTGRRFSIARMEVRRGDERLAAVMEVAQLRAQLSSLPLAPI